MIRGCCYSEGGDPIGLSLSLSLPPNKDILLIYADRKQLASMPVFLTKARLSGIVGY